MDGRVAAGRLGLLQVGAEMGMVSLGEEQRSLFRYFGACLLGSALVGT